VRDSCGLGDEQRSIVVPNFVRAPNVREDVSLDLLPSEPFILFLGDATFDKGASRLIAAYEALEAAPPLVMIGRCEVEIPGDRRIIALGPWPHDVAQEALRRALFVVVPTIMPEAFGLVALESAAAGKAVVASSVGALRHLVIHEETGLLVEPDDVSALRRAMERLVADASFRECLGRAARLRAMRYRADLVVPAFENAYRIAIEARRRRG
jgi:glycosyltransferase involved in cell wall biosynthesis